MPLDPLAEAKRILDAASDDVRRAVLAWLRARYPVHPLELEWHVPAEVILEAIARSPDLSRRGVRGLVAEAYFDQVLSAGIPGWRREAPPPNAPFDAILQRGEEQVRVQVKTQRRRSGRPMTSREASSSFSEGKLVVETQRTRAGKRHDGEGTRPYRFGEFDILAVCLEASTGDWTRFLYTVARWLLPRPDDASLIHRYQPVPHAPNSDWTDSLATAIGWNQSGIRKIIEV